MLSNITCFPAIQDLSTEANTEDGAGPRCAAKNRIDWHHGEQFKAQHADDVSKRCNRSSGNQPVADTPFAGQAATLATAPA